MPTNAAVMPVSMPMLNGMMKMTANSGTRAKVSEEFDKYGLELVDFFVNAITPPEEVQKAIDARSSMGAVGDLNAFMKFQAAQSMSKLAEQGGGGAGGGGAMGMGLGAGFGMMMPGMIQQSMAAGQGGAAGTPAIPRPPAPPSGGPAAAAAGAGLGAAAGAGGFDFGDLAPVTKDPKAMVASVAEAAGYTVVHEGAAVHVTVPLQSLRKQKVTIEFGKTDQEGHPIVSLWSICGPASEKNAMSLLRYNTKMLHGAFAVRAVNGGEAIVLQANLMAETIDPLEVSRALSALAWQADKVEQKLVGGDEN